METWVYIFSVCAIATVILSVVRMRYRSQLLRARAVAASDESVATLKSIEAALADVQRRLQRVETILASVE
jgi:hypothetical protein